MKTPISMRLKSLALLLAIITETVYPTSLLAIANQVVQPEFASYEDFNSPDMVNLITGDFTYNIPVLNVPSPEGGYQVSLAYHAGIQTEEESSWVGLGWNLNPGAMVRNLNQHPDDYSGEVVDTKVTNPGGTGWIKSVPYGVATYDSETGYGGAVNFAGIVDISYGDGHETVGISPIGLKIKDGITWSWDAEYMAQSLTSIGMNYILSGFSAENGGQATSIGVQAGMMALNGYITSKNSPASNSTYASGAYKLNVRTSANPFDPDTEYNWYLNGTTSISKYGTLYLGEMPTSTSIWGPEWRITAHNSDYSSVGAGTFPNQARFYALSHSTPGWSVPTSDMHVYYDGSNYGESNNPHNLSYDDFVVHGPGVSGVIKPYREDIGSLSNPVVDKQFHYCYFGPRFKEKTNYKVQFKYDGDISNSYTYHNMGSNLNTQPFKFEMYDTQSNSNNHDLKVKFLDPKVYINYPLDVSGTQLDPYNQYFSAAAQTESNTRPGGGRKDNKLAHGRHVEWFSNSEILNSTARSKGFLETHQASSIFPGNRDALPQNGIGAFAITNESGMTYHYSVPVYSKAEAELAKQSRWNPTTSSYINTEYKVTDNNRYASTWLLTGITGPDFIDRDDNGIIDDHDWGYWVKFDYGLFAMDYQWRNPYWGYGPDGENCKIGKKETYYLNKISTRTHSALFFKSSKKDGKGYYETNGFNDMFTNVAPAATGNYPVCTVPSSSLKLDYVCVIENSDCQKLFSLGGGGLGLTMVNQASDNQKLKNNDSYDKVLDNYDISSNSSANNINSFLTANQLQRIKFNYDYALCNKTYNSFDFDASGNPPVNDALTAPANTSVFSGKLTLRSVEFLGKSNFKAMPSYAFSYGNELDPDQNPDYHPFKSDGYGIYKSGGTQTRKNCESKGNQWSLSKIITPLGGEINVEYERDTYKTVNGRDAFLKLNLNPSLQACYSTSYPNPVQTKCLKIPTYYYGTTALSDYISPGDEVWCKDASGNWSFNSYINAITGITSQYTSISLSNDFDLSNTEAALKLKKRYGGGIRVKSISTKDENNNEFKTNYIYTLDGLETGTTSGVASYEPTDEKSSIAEYDFYKYYTHPYSTILYSHVTVINGKNDPVFKEASRTTYDFITPHYSYLTSSFIPWSTQGDCHVQQATIPTQHSRTTGTWNTIDNTSAIGSLKEIKQYNQFDNLVSRTSFDYTDNANSKDYANNLGHYTESTLLWEKIHFEDSPSWHWVKHRLVQSYLLKRPHILKSVTTTKDRLVSKREILEYDYQTGIALKTRSTYGNFEKYEDVIVPAYKTYSEMGSKIYLDPANSIYPKNMMNSISEQYSYVYDKNNQKKPLGGIAYKFAKNANHLLYNGSGYVRGPYAAPNNGLMHPYRTVWLPIQTFTWKSAVEENGTIKGAFTTFPGNSTNNWLKTSEVTLYDPFSRPLEVKDINSKPSSVKYGYNNSFASASSQNTEYEKWCYSGAEDSELAGSNYYQGGAEGSNFQYLSNAYAHTGSYCSRVAPGNSAFKYIISSPVKGKYRASVWIHQNGYQGAYLTCIGYDAYNNAVPYSISGQNQWAGAMYNSNGLTNSSVEKAGNWYLFSIDVNLDALPANVAYLAFEVRNASTTIPYVYADDFRVHPLQSPMISNVYDPKTGKVLATLNTDNYATKYTYDLGGKLVSVYQESKLGFKLTSSSNYHTAR